MRYLNKDEVAQLLHVTVRTITSYMTKGLLPEPRRLGRRLLWDEVELQHLMAGCPKPAEPRPVPPQLAEPLVSVPRRPGRPRKLLRLDA